MSLVSGQTKEGLELVAAILQSVGRGKVVGHSTGGFGTLTRPKMIGEHVVLTVPTAILRTSPGPGRTLTPVTPDVVLSERGLADGEKVDWRKIERAREQEVSRAVEVLLHSPNQEQSR